MCCSLIEKCLSVPQGFHHLNSCMGEMYGDHFDVLKESWEATEKSNESVVSHIISMRENLESMLDLVRESLTKETVCWYCCLRQPTR